MSLQVREFLQHILDETHYIMTSSEGVTKADFLENETLKRAYVKELTSEVSRSSEKPLSSCQKRYAKSMKKRNGVV